MKLSIIIPTKNEEKNLPRLLKSLSNSPFPLEIIIVDNQSTDGTLDVIENFESKLQSTGSKVRLLTEGPERSAQRNAGAKTAQSKYLLFLDADMEIKKPLLKELFELLKKGVETVIIPEKSVGHDFWGRAVALERNCYQGSKDLEAPRFITTKLFLKIGGYDPKLIAGEDWDLSERLKKKGVKITRTRLGITHHEAKGFFPNLQRKWYYTQHIRNYADKHPARFAQQSQISSRLAAFWSTRRRLIAYPAHTLAFLLIKAIIYVRWRLTSV